MYSKVPEELKLYKQWICWKLEETMGGKPTKIPYSPYTGYFASVDNPTTWATFDDAVTAANTGMYSGIGFVLTDEDPFTFIDLDNPYEIKEDGSYKYPNPEQIMQRQIKVFNEFDTYAERSPSGKGLHLICKGAVPSGRKREAIEVYSSLRYMTMTGDVYSNRPIVNKQELITMLHSQMGGVVNQAIHGDFVEREDDSTIIERALNAVNGDKFKRLLDGDWQGLYPSQSEADFAFVDIVAFYTQNIAQISRIFLASPLGQRDKAKRTSYVMYMINKSFDRQPQVMDIEGFTNQFNDAIARRKSLEEVTAEPTEADIAALVPEYGDDRASPQGDPYSVPPGLMGELAKFFYDAAPRPVPEIAISAALGLMAGVCGRAYNVSGTGLNIYLLLLAATGSGKEAMASGIDKLISAVKPQCEAAAQFVGPGRVASGQALVKYMTKVTPCFVSVQGEFGLTFRQFNSPNISQATLVLKQMYLDLYNKSGIGHSLKPTIYSDLDKNTALIHSPAFSILAESTPETFYNIIDESLIADGLLPRFTVVEYKGIRVPFNDNHGAVQPNFELQQKFIQLVIDCNALMQNGNAFPVPFDSEAKTLMQEFSTKVDRYMNANKQEVIKQLWNRAHVKALKIAALIAVGIDNKNPMITKECCDWAIKFITYDIATMSKMFDKGEIGLGEDRQLNDIKKVIYDYVTLSYKEVMNYHVKRKLHDAKVVPIAYISRRTAAMASFRKDRVGHKAAMARCLSTLIEHGILVELGANQLQKEYSTRGKCYIVSDLDQLLS